MRIGIFGRKVGMTQVFDEKGALVAATVIDTSDCVITQVKTKDKDGYVAIQVGVGNRKPQNVNKAATGHFKKANTAPKAQVQEIRLEDTDDVTALTAGTALSCGMFQKGDRVDVTGVSKGKGFQGPMKRHNFAGKNMTHGTSKYFRHGGSVGMHTYPGRVFKGKKMPGQMGSVTKTVQSVHVLESRPEENLLILRGGIPGGKRTFVLVRSAIKRPVPADRKLV